MEGSQSVSTNCDEAVRIRKNTFRENLLFFELQAKMNCKNGPEADGLKPTLVLGRNGLSRSSPDLLDGDQRELIESRDGGYHNNRRRTQSVYNGYSTAQFHDRALDYESYDVEWQSNCFSIDGLKKNELRPAPSVEEILQSVKDLRMRQTMNITQNGVPVTDSPSAVAWSERNKEALSSSSSSSSLVHFEAAERRVYANVAVPHEPFYENVCGGDPDQEEPIYERIPEEPIYDVPRKWPGGPRPVVPADPSMVPSATQLILKAQMAPPSSTTTPTTKSTRPTDMDSDTLSDCDKDSLEENGTITGESRSLPDIPSPDYGSDDDDAAYGVYDEYSSDFSDSGIGESDGRSTYYLDDKGLEVIIEEEEGDLEDDDDNGDAEDEDEYDDYSCSEKLSSLDCMSTTATGRSACSNDYQQREDDISDELNSRRGFSSGDVSPDNIPRRESIISSLDKFDLPDSAVDLDELSGSDRLITSPDSVITSDGSLMVATSVENDECPLILVTPPEIFKEGSSEFDLIVSQPPVPEVTVNSPTNDDKPSFNNIPPEETVNQSTSPGNSENLSESELNEHRTGDNGHSEVYANGNLQDDDLKSEEHLSCADDLKPHSGDEEIMDVKHLLPSVKALRSQFETKSQNGFGSNTLPRSFSGSLINKPTTQVNSLTLEKPRLTSRMNEKHKDSGRPYSVISHSYQSIPELLHSLNKEGSATLPTMSKSKTFEYSRNNANMNVRAAKPIFSVEPPVNPDDVIPSIIAQFGTAAIETNVSSSQKVSTHRWDPVKLMEELYEIQSPLPLHSSTVSFINLEGYLDRLPSGRKKGTFWNAWKRNYFKLKDGVLYYYEHQFSDTPIQQLNLMGGYVDSMETTMLGIDDEMPVDDELVIGINNGKGHYLVVRGSNQAETNKWKDALLTHMAENYHMNYVQPVPACPHFYEDVIIVDLGSSSVRAGIWCNQPTLPQIFFPSVSCTNRETMQTVYGIEALRPEVRGNSPVFFPVRPSGTLNKNSVDIEAVKGIFKKAFEDLDVDARKYEIQLSLPRSFSIRARAEVLRVLFEEFGAKAVNITSQNVLSLLSYNLTTGIVVDIGERMDVIPIMDGYIVEAGVSRIPYGGSKVADHLRHFLLQNEYSMASDVESYLVRYLMEKLCYCAENYNEEFRSFESDRESFEKTISVRHFFPSEVSWDEITLSNGRFQAPEALFNPESWGLDHPGVHKLVYKAILESSVDTRKEMTRNIVLSGGITLLPGFATRLEVEVNKLTPAALVPKVHGSSYRHHAAYLGACVYVGQTSYQHTKIMKEDWMKSGASCIQKYHL